MRRDSKTYVFPDPLAKKLKAGACRDVNHHLAAQPAEQLACDLHLRHAGSKP